MTGLLLLTNKNKYKYNNNFFWPNSNGLNKIEIFMQSMNSLVCLIKSDLISNILHIFLSLLMLNRPNPEKPCIVRMHTHRD